MSDKNQALNDVQLEQVSGGADTLGEGQPICCTRCGCPLPKGAGGVMTQDPDGATVLQFECENPSCNVKYYEVYFPSMLPGKRAWDVNGKLI